MEFELTGENPYKLYIICTTCHPMNVVEPRWHNINMCQNKNMLYLILIQIIAFRQP